MNSSRNGLPRPHPCPDWITGRIYVLIIVLLTFVALVTFGLDPVTAVAVVPAIGLAAARVAVRLLGRLPRNGSA